MRGISRRQVMAGVAACAMRPAWGAVPESGRLAFRAFRNDGVLGTHVLEFRRQGEALTVAIAVDYVVKLGPITLFRYAMRATETWQGGVLTGVNATTDDDGTKAYMRAVREGGRLVVDGSKSGRYVAPEGAIAATHWNRREVEAPMVNPQDGELLRFAAAAPAEGTVALASGAMVPARRFALRGPSELDLWYDSADVWTGLRAVVRDGSVITYRRE